MSSTPNLNLFKHDNPATNKNLFDVAKSLNENWDKIDDYVYNQEATRQENEQIRQANEETRQNQETTRQSNESTRQEQEEIRKTNEDARKAEESKRNTNEEARETAETAREQYITDLKGRVDAGEFKGDPNVLSIGTVEKGNEAKASITGNSPNQKLNLVLPKGDAFKYEDFTAEQLLALTGPQRRNSNYKSWNSNNSRCRNRCKSNTKN